MNIEIGTDICNIERIKKAINKHGEKFLKRFLNEQEIATAKTVESIAGYWAAKEAISKALGCGIGKELSFLDIEIYKKNNNKPYFRIIEKNFNILNSSISISHDSGFAIAVVIILRE